MKIWIFNRQDEKSKIYFIQKEWGGIGKDFEFFHRFRTRFTSTMLLL